MNAYVLIKRTEEELSLLNEEMENVVSYCNSARSAYYINLTVSRTMKASIQME